MGLGAFGTVSSNLTWRLCSSTALTIGARAYGGTVTVDDCGSQNLTATLAAGSPSFGGLVLQPITHDWQQFR